MQTPRTRLTGALAAATLAAGALAAVPTAARAAGCTTGIGETTNAFSTVIGNGSLSGGCASGTKADLTVWRSRWFGWEPMSTVTLTGPGRQSVYYNCAGTGEHDFQTTISLGAGGGEKTSNTIEMYCP